MAKAILDNAQFELVSTLESSDTEIDMVSIDDDYNLEDQKTGTIPQTGNLMIINKEEETQTMKVRFSAAVENGLIGTKQRYTITKAIASDAATVLQGLVNSDDFTDDADNADSGLVIASFPIGSLVLITVDSALMRYMIRSIATRFVQFPSFDKTTDVTVGNGRDIFVTPKKYNGDELTIANAVITGSAGVTGDTTINIYNVTKAQYMLSTAITIVSGATTGSGVVDTAADDIDTGDILRVDVLTVSSGTAPKGLNVNLEFGE